MGEYRWIVEIDQGWLFGGANGTGLAKGKLYSENIEHQTNSQNFAVRQVEYFNKKYENLQIKRFAYYNFI